MRRFFSILLVLCLFTLIPEVQAVNWNYQETAHVRFAHAAFGTPSVDFFIGRDALTDRLHYGDIDGQYYSIPAGTFRLSVNLYGEGFNTALVALDAVLFSAGHDYLVVFYGEGDSMELIIFDLTTLAGDFTAGSPSQSPWFYINLLQGAEVIDIQANGETVIDDLAFGEIAYYMAPMSQFVEQSIANNDPQQVIDIYEQAAGEPYLLSFVIMEGGFPGTYGADYTFLSEIRADTDLLTYLNAISDDEAASYRQFAALLEQSGLLNSLLNPEQEYFFAVPDDAALSAAAIPQEASALQDFLLYHILPLDAYDPDEEAVYRTLTQSAAEVQIDPTGESVRLNDVEVTRTRFIQQGQVGFISDVLWSQNLPEGTDTP